MPLAVLVCCKLLLQPYRNFKLVFASNQFWYDRNFVAQGLRPLAGMFCLGVRMRRIAYRNGWLASTRLPVPVIIVGNISVGGTGKTPLVIWLAQYCQTRGWHPGVLTRGYRGSHRQWPQLVTPYSDPNQVGDESVLLARRCGCPVVAGPQRITAGQLLLEKCACDLIICDDGLQHYPLQRDIEIAVVDGQRRVGNGLCLPAGPLREPAWRLQDFDLTVVNGQALPGELGMSLHCDQAVNLTNPSQTRPLQELRHQQLLAVAGIGNPQRFFAMLREQGLNVEQTKIFPDHHAFKPQDFAILRHRPLVMTEKDVVKCERFLDDANMWYVPVTAVLAPSLVAKLEVLLYPWRIRCG